MIYRADKSIYHALGYGVFMYLKAVMTFEQVREKETSFTFSRLKCVLEVPVYPTNNAFLINF